MIETESETSISLMYGHKSEWPASSLYLSITVLGDTDGLKYNM